MKKDLESLNKINSRKNKKNKSRKDDEYDFNVQSEVSPKVGRVLCFDGNHYHSMRPTSAGNVRFIAVFNILLNKKE